MEFWELSLELPGVILFLTLKHLNLLGFSSTDFALE